MVDSTDAVYVVCLVHLLLCVIFIAELVPGSGAVVLGGVAIYPTLQCWFAAFNCVSIVSIIAAGVGALYLIQSHLEIYFGLLGLSLLVDLAWVVVFGVYGHSCSTTIGVGALQASVSCGFKAGGVVMVLVLLLIFKLTALYVVYLARKAVREKYSKELLPYLKRSLKQSVGDIAFANMEQEFGDEDGAMAEAFAPAPPAQRSPGGQQSLSFRSMPAAQRSGTGPAVAYGTMDRPGPGGGPVMSSLSPEEQRPESEATVSRPSSRGSRR